MFCSICESVSFVQLFVSPIHFGLHQASINHCSDVMDGIICLMCPGLKAPHKYFSNSAVPYHTYFADSKEKQEGLSPASSVAFPHVTQISCFLISTSCKNRQKTVTAVATQKDDFPDPHNPTKNSRKMTTQFYGPPVETPPNRKDSKLTNKDCRRHLKRLLIIHNRFLMDRFVVQ